MHIAIIGAGLAGLSCARELLVARHTVTVYEKHEDAGGRTRTCQTELGGFDFGAQYFTAQSEAFSKRVNAWRKAGWAAPWSGKLVAIGADGTQPAGRGQQRLVAVPGMGALAQQLALAVDVRKGQRVNAIRPHGNQWLLKIESDTVAIEASAGPFDAVILAMPADQAALLTNEPAPELAAQAAQIRMAPCWSLMLAFSEPLGLRYDGAWLEGGRLSWIAQDASKPQRRPGEHWVAHASAAWSEEHLMEDPERAKEKLLRAFHDATGTAVQPVHAAVHRWPYAQAQQTLPGSFLWDRARRIGACGDWFDCGLEGAGRIENACLSGVALAGAID
ncbi:NAD(P)/FAD-dependent oxidoreductase [Noviherbaspirillum pedocola]|uniref:FAD-dependent oxidoreductase n=1 Tax=Noviherbaspirillum pedocola TaxID=2801341 RepID=A0A934SWN4_9BURK|nr:FAD-dependent oxidoreductase [Noviherbaspirillum pedocola]MBK4734069.1 FAD-dependent oxidoreductase [Noviherbaspirillum pedocola]